MQEYIWLENLLYRIVERLYYFFNETIFSEKNVKNRNICIFNESIDIFCIFNLDIIQYIYVQSKSIILIKINRYNLF